MRHAIVLALLAACSKAPAEPAKSEPAAVAQTDTHADKKAEQAAAIAALVGTTPPEWKVERWLSSPPLVLEKLRGSVVLVRWWTAGCPFCATTAPTLRELDETYRARGLIVVGMYHHKEPTPFDPAIYEETAKKFGFTFPVAFDPEWQTFESWHRDKDGKTVSTGWTSVTFVLDKRGVIRHVHPGGSYIKGEPAYDELRAVIDRLLAE